MKISIILGVLHMIFGVSVSLFNYWHFKNIAAIWCEFLPQLIFFTSIFLYLVVLMFIKWIKYDATSSSCAPSILITFINMLMLKKPDESKSGCDPFMFPAQETVQDLLVLVALCCVPWMLLAKPLYIVACRRRARIRAADEFELKELMKLEQGHQPSIRSNDTTIKECHEGPMSEICIHQAIHTIEYVLGSISHTASYLRLWALSLAHSQLTEVLWVMVMQLAFVTTSLFAGFIIPIIFMFWAVASVLILVVMEGLSAFLHTLRLHWVEFQSKFYVGQGWQFVPFSTRKAIRRDNGW